MDEPTLAPDPLEAVRAFINTRDIEAGTDVLASTGQLDGWLAQHGFSGPATPDELDRLRMLRETLRASCHANHQQAPLPETIASELTEMSRWAGARITFGGPSGWRLATATDGARGYAGTIVAATVAAMTDDTWKRLKVCRNDTCQWAFYDHSRTRSRSWCSMRLCGNRAKQHRWRERARTDSANASDASAQS